MQDFDIDVGDPIFKLRFDENNVVRVPFWKLYYDLLAIEQKYRTETATVDGVERRVFADDKAADAYWEEYKQYIAQLLPNVGSQVGIGDATAFQRKFWKDIEAKKELADGQRPLATPSASVPPATPSMQSLSPFTESPCPPCTQG